MGNKVNLLCFTNAYKRRSCTGRGNLKHQHSFVFFFYGLKVYHNCILTHSLCWGHLWCASCNMFFQYDLMYFRGPFMLQRTFQSIFLVGRRFHVSSSPNELKTKKMAEPKEIKIPVPFGHIAGKSRRYKRAHKFLKRQ